MWVSCTKPASIIKVSPVDYKTIDSHTLNVSIGAGWGVAPAFSAKDDIATLKGYADYKTNDIAIFDFNKTPALQFDIKNKNSFPAGVFFTENFK